MKDIANIRMDYQLAALTETAVGDDPFVFFTRWFNEAVEAEITEVNAMTLATVSPENKADARIVLLKGVEDGEFVFFTNYNSAKGVHIQNNPNISLLFFWKELERQVRIEGVASKIAPEKSTAYFNSRPEGSRIGAWASPQSSKIPSRSVLDDNFEKFTKDFSGAEIPRPEHWGGYGVTPASIEFWQGRASRMHDRILFEKDDNGNWQKARLAP